MGAVVGEDRVDPVRDGLDQAVQEVGGGAACHLLMQFDEGELHEVSVDRDQEESLPSAVRTSAMSMWKKPIG